MLTLQMHVYTKMAGWEVNCQFSVIEMWFAWVEITLNSIIKCFVQLYHFTSIYVYFDVNIVPHSNHTHYKVQAVLPNYKHSGMFVLSCNQIGTLSFEVAAKTKKLQVTLSMF